MAVDEPGTDPPSEPVANTSARVGEAIGLGVIGLVVVGGFLSWSSREEARPDQEGRGATAERVAPASDDFVGDDTCAGCHPGIDVYHSRSGHSRTLRPAADRVIASELSGRTVPDPEWPGVSWSFLLDDERFVIDRTRGDSVERLPVDFAIGSGYNATTFVSILDAVDDDPHRPTIREHRLTSYADGSVRVTPGQQSTDPLPGTDALGRIHEHEDALRCFGCHTTLTSADDFETLDVATMIPNITCERCHGPGRDHVAHARADAPPDLLAMPFGPGRYSTADEMRLCGACHRHPSEFPEALLRPDNPDLSRFQPVGLMNSPCYTKSNGALSCNTCHDPHDRPSKDPATYTATCLSCHKPTHPDHTPCPVSPSRDCTSCHMPRVDAGQRVFFADHWIRVHPGLAGLPANAE